MKGHTHFRRCHVCGSLESVIDKKVDKCGGCGKHLAPFFYYDEKKASVIDELGGFSRRSENGNEENYQPILGLSTYW